MLSEAQILKKLRDICRSLSGADETITFGHPTFRVKGKAFAVLEEDKGELGICVKVEKDCKEFFSMIRVSSVRRISESMVG